MRAFTGLAPLTRQIDRILPYKTVFLLLTLAIVPLLYVNAWLSLASAIASYVAAAKLANRQFDRAFLNRNERKSVSSKH